MVKWEQRLIDLDIAAEFETALKQFPFLKKGTRGRESGFYAAGIIFLPLPKCG